MISNLEREFENLWEDLFPQIELEAEFRLIPSRRFRFDYVHHESRIAIEINGGTFNRMGHSSPSGIKRDYEKLNLAHAMGWRVFQLTSEMITIEWLNIIADAIKVSNK
jgi:very-short-patch-repair endonuclease